MERAVFVDRMDPADSDEVAAIWKAHDATDLPREIGVQRRTLYRFGGLYLHVVDGSDGELGLADRIHANRHRPLYLDVRDRLGPYLKPYSPDVRGLLDTLAVPFYEWRADDPSRRIER